jgi:DNA-binding Lrp family transcriptional regulator
VWIELRCRYNGANNGRLSLSFRQAAERLGLGKSTVARAFKELVEKGFLKLRRAWSRWYGRLATEWILTDIKYDGYPATRDWQNWRPPAKPEKQKSVPRRHRQSARCPAMRTETQILRTASVLVEGVCLSSTAPHEDRLYIP